MSIGTEGIRVRTADGYERTLELEERAALVAELEQDLARLRARRRSAGEYAQSIIRSDHHSRAVHALDSIDAQISRARLLVSRAKEGAFSKRRDTDYGDGHVIDAAESERNLQLLCARI